MGGREHFVIRHGRGRRVACQYLALIFPEASFQTVRVVYQQLRHLHHLGAAEVAVGQRRFKRCV